MSIISYWDSPPDRNRQRTPKEAVPVTIWKCPDDGTNLPTHELPPNATEVRCTHCGQLLSLVRIDWSGRVR
jgi:hypothetical protein